MTIDLRNDAREITERIARQVDRYASEAARDKSLPRVSAIEVGYAFDQRGWFFCHFDTREDHDRDGEWTVFLDQEPYSNDLLERTHWYEGICGGEPGPTTFIMMDGSTRVLEDVTEEEVARFLGEFIKAVVLQANHQGLFRKLPTRDTCQIDIEEFNGNWAWPEYDGLGKVNLI